MTNNTKDKIMSVLSIIYNFEFVYIFKIVVFIIMIFMSRVNVNVGNYDLLPTLIFSISVLLDNVILSKNVKDKAFGLNIIYVLYLLYVVSSLVFMLLLYLKQIKITVQLLKWCNRIIIFYFMSPLLEMIFDINTHIKDEYNNKYS